MIQPYLPLPAPIEAALRDSIKRWGVLHPVTEDQHGEIIDGHHRARIADEEKVHYARTVVHVKDDAEAREVARTLNEDRRQMSPEQRRPMVVELVNAGHSQRAIATALGVDRGSIRNDASKSGGLINPPGKVLGLDGKNYPAAYRKAPEPVPNGLRGKMPAGFNRTARVPLASRMERALDQLQNTVEILTGFLAEHGARAHQDYSTWTGRMSDARSALSHLINAERRERHVTSG